MVGTRWESSNRPLFIKTVWKDGHHHVVLREDEEVDAQTARSDRRKNSSGRFKSAKKTASPSPDTSPPFKVPSVKLLLANLRTFNSRPKRIKTERTNFTKSALPFDIIPSDSIRYNDINKQVSFKNEKRKNFRIIPKSNSVEVNKFYDIHSSTGTPPPFSYDDYCLDQFNTSLSERVLIWLDLAIQNQKLSNEDFKKRVVTAQPCQIMERIKINTSENFAKIQKEEAKIETQNDPLVTSRMECDHVDTIPDDKKPKSRPGAKRQLHIFLPHLPKKSDSGSFLSSKSNSLLNKM